MARLDRWPNACWFPTSLVRYKHGTFSNRIVTSETSQQVWSYEHTVIAKARRDLHNLLTLDYRLYTMRMQSTRQNLRPPHRYHCSLVNLVKVLRVHLMAYKNEHHLIIIKQAVLATSSPGNLEFCKICSLDDQMASQTDIYVPSVRFVRSFSHDEMRLLCALMQAVLLTVFGSQYEKNGS